MLRKVWAEAEIVSDPERLEVAQKIILPGVGAFDTGLKKLKETGFRDVLNRLVLGEKKPILGICLGMQLFALSSEEGSSKGLGWIPCHVKKFDFSNLINKALKIPHIGWNYVNPAKKHPIFENVPLPMRFYFVHSYHYICDSEKYILAKTHYGYDFVCAVLKDNIIGVQFHPEKSHKYGLQLLKNFVERV